MHPDQSGYYRYTGPQRLDKAFNSLEGILGGVAADGVIKPAEVATLEAWLDENEPLVNKDSFRELAQVVRSVVADARVDDDELEDLRWLCKRFQKGNHFFDALTSDLQRLHAFIGGIAADGVISVEELRGLRAWLDDHESLRTCWPYDEVDALVTATLVDQRIDAVEHRQLMAFFSEFVSVGAHRALSDQMQGVLNDAKTPISGLCAVCPEIVFSGRQFCFTGSSVRTKRTELARLVEKLGGRFSKSINQKTDYLVIGGEGNSTWAYACYGRKVETATHMRRQGAKVLIVHEFDFWDGIESQS